MQGTTIQARPSGDIFAACREQVSAEDAARFYGLEVKRGWLRCPFHGERTASLKFYPDGSWHCFGCHAGGSSIDFTMKLHGLTPLEAVKRLDQDFQLGLDVSAPLSPAERERRRRLRAAKAAFEDWRTATLRQLTGVCFTARRAMQKLETAVDLDAVSEAEAMSLQVREQCEEWVSLLCGGTMEEKMEVFRERKEIERICGKILQHTKTN